MAHLRVHTEYVSIDALVLFMREKTELIIVSKEQGNKEHLHIVFELKKTLSTFRQQLLKSFPLLKGNKSYSLEVIKTTIEQMVRYACKGTRETLPCVLFSNPSVNIEECHRKYYQIIDETNVARSSSSVKSNVKSKTWIEKLYENIQEMYKYEISVIQTNSCIMRLTDIEKEDLEKSRKVIFAYMCKCLGKSVRKINDNILRDLFEGIINSINQDGDFSTEYSMKLYNNIYKR